VSQIGANFEIHEFINSGWPKWCPRGSPQKRPSLKKKRHFTRTGRMLILVIFLLGATGRIQQGLRVDFFAVVPGRAENGSPPIFRKSSNKCFA